MYRCTCHCSLAITCCYSCYYVHVCSKRQRGYLELQPSEESPTPSFEEDISLPKQRHLITFSMPSQRDESPTATFEEEIALEMQRHIATSSKAPQREESPTPSSEEVIVPKQQHLVTFTTPSQREESPTLSSEEATVSMQRRIVTYSEAPPPQASVVPLVREPVITTGESESWMSLYLHILSTAGYDVERL